MPRIARRVKPHRLGPPFNHERRFGARLNVEEVTIVLPADARGFVRFYGQRDVAVPLSIVPLYLDGTYGEATPGDQSAHCGFNPVQVFGGA
jgi:hypothetical protein